MIDSKRERRQRDRILATVLEGGRRPSDRLREAILDERSLPDLDRSECDRRARQAAVALLEWCEEGSLNPEEVIEEARWERQSPRCDGGDSA